MKEKLMGADSLLSTMKISGIKTPKYTWKCQLISGTHWLVEEGKQPNWFHRKMQTLCFGIIWSKNETV
jgi:hypothetical protein